MKNIYVDFFLKLGFNLNPEKFCIDKNSELIEKLNNAVFFYSSPPQTNTSFYLITVLLNEDEKKIICKYIWNKNNADLLFLLSSEKNTEIVMSYAKYSPVVKYEKSILDNFDTSDADSEKIEKIRHWQFDSGAFWFNYYSFIKTSKYKGIDKELAITMNDLKNQVNDAMCSQIQDREKRNKIVQALIDRTLYIKYLEDNHIINSFFYKHYFDDETLDYRKLLLNADNDINKLFKIIQEIFCNKLFDEPTIDDEYLSKEVRNSIAQSFNRSSDGQLRLFDFQFNVLPIEFISYIYEVFLTDEQKVNGIYYTPKKLAQLIVDDVIYEDKIGSILDPSCGSGMFLIVGFQRLLEIAQKQNLEPQNNIEKIRYRTKLLSENIFGIEKQSVAQRLTLFSLSLQIFRGIPPSEIRDFIKKELETNEKIDLFSEYNFYNNILCQNTLDVEKLPFKDKTFDYIVGNPPFFKIPNTSEYSIENSFLNNYDVNIESDKTIKAKDIIGTQQISQCFFLKLKDWSYEETRFGFVSNSSSFYNEKSIDFQKYFYANYGIEKIYELSRVKKILFEKAKESVVSVIFNNKFTDNTIEYYPVNLGLFSEKPFELLIIQEDKVIPFEQKKLINQTLRLRDFLVGNEHDLNFFIKLNNNRTLSDFILYHNNKPFIYEGLKIVGEKAICQAYKLSKEDWTGLSREEQNKYFEKFRNENTSNKKNKEFCINYVRYNDIGIFITLGIELFLRDDVSNFERGRNPEIFAGDKIIFNRIGSKIKAIYSNTKMYFDFASHSFKLNNRDLYYLINAILNSNIINYYLDFFVRKRFIDSYPRIGHDDILNIPIPKELDEDLVAQISEISKDLTDGKYEYSEKEQELNELIFDLYDLSYVERQRIRDYFLPQLNKKAGKIIIEKYKSVLANSLNFYLKNPIKKDDIEVIDSAFNLFVAKIPLKGNSNNPTAKKVQKFTLNEIFKQDPHAKIISGQEKIFGNGCVYIIKEGINKNWTETKAFEDRKEIIKHLI
jgi:hypothetical protein